MVCNNCIHNEVCAYGENRSNGSYCTGDKCQQFEDKNLFIELPVPLGADVYELNWEYTDDDFSCNEVWFVEKVPFTMWRLDHWGEYVFETEEEALEQLGEKRKR